MAQEKTGITCMGTRFYCIQGTCWKTLTDKSRRMIGNSKSNRDNGQRLQRFEQNNFKDYGDDKKHQLPLYLAQPRHVLSSDSGGNLLPGLVT